MCGDCAHEVEYPRISSDIGGVAYSLAGNRDRQTSHHERVRVILGIDERQLERVALTDGYRVRHELVDFLAIEDAALREILSEKRIGRCQLFGEKRDRRDDDFPRARRGVATCVGLRGFGATGERCYEGERQMQPATSSTID